METLWRRTTLISYTFLSVYQTPSKGTVAYKQHGGEGEKEYLEEFILTNPLLDSS